MKNIFLKITHFSKDVQIGIRNKITFIINFIID